MMTDEDYEDAYENLSSEEKLYLAVKSLFFLGNLERLDNELEWFELVYLADLMEFSKDPKYEDPHEYAELEKELKGVLDQKREELFARFFVDPEAEEPLLSDWDWPKGPPPAVPVPEEEQYEAQFDDSNKENDPPVYQEL